MRRAVVREIAKVRAKPGSGDALAAAYDAAIAVVLRHPGATRASVMRQVEDPEVFVLLIDWLSIEAHEEFGQSAAIHEFRAPLAGLVAAGEAAHYTRIVGLSSEGDRNEP